ncbi:hypothetical protein LINPERPRIM_LOCUS39727, partial [Linum perenne]
KKIPTLLDLSPRSSKKISIDRRRKLLRTPPDLQSPAANSYVGPPISSAAIPIDDIWTPEIQALCPSSKAPSRNSLPEALSPYFRVSTAVAPLPSLSSFFRASNRDIFLLTAAPPVEVILREGRSFQSFLILLNHRFLPPLYSAFTH